MNAPIHFTAPRAHEGHNGIRYRVRLGAVLTVRDAAPEPESVSDWTAVHARIVALGAERAAREHELCRWLRAAQRLAVHARMGFASLAEYAERVLGLRPRQLEERMRVARALETLPELDRALGRGELCWSAVRELSRVATAETEGAWRRWAGGRRLREVEQTVAARHPGQRPEGRPDPSRVKHRLRYEVRAETMALFRDLEARVRADLGVEPGGEVDDDMVLFEIARRALGGPDDDGRASYQVAVSRCPECLRVSVEGGGVSHEADAVVAEMAACDCQELGRVDGDEQGTTHVGPEERDGCNGGFAAAGESSHTEASAERDASGALEAAGESTHRATGYRDAEETPDAQAHVGGGSGGARLTLQRATQTIPPATRRAVTRRDRGRCSVPSCANHRWLDVHHVVPRAEGGQHDPENCCLVCGAHHRALHAGRLVIEGTARSGFTFRHADGTLYGGRPRPAELEVTAQVLGALEHLGFGASRARALVDEVRKRGAPGGIEAFLRAALLLA